ncbi:MAG: hypothetical protein JKY84_10090 [Emcibacteraceae bacterium]|nr:hypothetical protein [Emcibacteraceae bacterium]
MIVYRKTKMEILSGFLNAKNFLIGLMVATFLLFASGTNITMESEDVFSIMIGASLFTVAAGLLIWAREISNKFYR